MNLMRYFSLGFACFMLFCSCENKDKAEAAEFFERANYHFKKREFDKAYEFYSEAIEKVPDFADAYNNRGIILQKQGNLDGAQREFTKAIELDDSFGQAKLNLASAMIDASTLLGVKELLEKVEKEYKDSAQFYQVRGRYFLASENPNEAIPDFERSLSMFTNDVETLTNLGFAYYQQKEFEKAKVQFLEALKLNKSFPFALNNLSATYAQLNDWSKALFYSEKAIEVSPNELTFINTHSLNLLESNNLIEAKVFISQALKLSPSNPYSLRNEAISLIISEQYKEAIGNLISIEKDNQGVEFIYYYLGKAFSKMGKKSQACEYFSKGAILKDTRSKEQLNDC